MADDTARVWAKVDKNGPVPVHRPDLGPCWIWTGKPDVYGYGRIMWAGKTRKAHRVVYELLRGSIAAGRTLDHLCHNGSGCDAGNGCVHRRCVNPAHLEPVRSKVTYRGMRFCLRCSRDRLRAKRAAAGSRA